ncbi:unnamed protein product [Litomosoides sigmodontis]|uniref:Uncharacterized protein n=1 Tax=Litomosoides sigmodontis TaxID=42156 RepID=A0A3P6VAK2_LITSI|nr:unnamed protein product [Litomosoides sigmodontis]
MELPAQCCQQARCSYLTADRVNSSATQELPHRWYSSCAFTSAVLCHSTRATARSGHGSVTLVGRRLRTKGVFLLFLH